MTDTCDYCGDPILMGEVRAVVTTVDPDADHEGFPPPVSVKRVYHVQDPACYADARASMPERRLVTFTRATND